MPDDIDKLIASLGDGDLAVRSKAEADLVEIGTPAVEALITAFDDREIWEQAICVVVEIGPSAVEPLCLSLGKLYSNIISPSAVALGRIADRAEMPRKILLVTTMSPQSRIACLNALFSTRAAYIEKDSLRHYVKYRIPDLPRFLKVMSRSTDSEIRRAAQELLHYIESDVLLRPSQPAGFDLLRAGSGEGTEVLKDELLHGTDAPSPPIPRKSNLLQRLRGSKRKRDK